MAGLTGATVQGADSITQSEAQTFVKSFYRAIEESDLDKVMDHFDETVDYYSYGKKDKAFIADVLTNYFESFPLRFFSVGEIKFQPGSIANRVSVAFNISFSLRSRAEEDASIGRSQVNWDLIKRDGALKIVRFTGTSVENTSPAAPK
jgi:hypothetical protein